MEVKVQGSASSFRSESPAQLSKKKKLVQEVSRRSPLGKKEVSNFSKSDADYVFLSSLHHLLVMSWLRPRMSVQVRQDICKTEERERETVKDERMRKILDSLQRQQRAVKTFQLHVFEGLLRLFKKKIHRHTDISILSKSSLSRKPRKLKCSFFRDFPFPLFLNFSRRERKGLPNPLTESPSLRSRILS